MLISTRALVWISASALAAIILPGRSNIRAQDPPQQPIFRTEANYVRVDMFPTTRDGVPVADLRQDELQILEDGVPQKIEQFEHVVIRGNVPQEARREPATNAESRAMLQDARARVFVLFLDTLHVEQSASRTISKPLVDMVERVLGPDDLIAVMTPQMSSSDITFARKTTILEGFLNRSWWGERDALIPSDRVEEQYKLCYPSQDGLGTSAVARAMIDRRREKLTLDALGNLMTFLRDAREERKAIIAITDGWVLFRPDDRLMQQGDDRSIPPPPPPINVDPRNGRLTTKDTTMTGAQTRSDCEQDRISLAQLDHQFQFARLLDEANRANASFYPVDPRGLAVFDTPIGPDRPPTMAQDNAQLRQRSTALRDLASSTDGTAVLATNDISGALRRVVADLSSYYLLGYYSTNAKLDGKFRSITVRVQRPGVQVRARRGYLAATAAAAVARGTTAPPVSASAAAEAAAAGAVDAVVGSLARFAREAPLRTQAASGWNAGGAAAVWVVGEVAAGQRWIGGGEANVTLIHGGTSVSTARAVIAPGGRTFRVAMTSTAPLAAGDYQVRVRARGAGASDAPLDDVVTLEVAVSPDPIGALLLRRGLSTGNKSVATADSRFRRNERLGVEVPARLSAPLTARLLDRTGKPLTTIPVAVAPRTDADGSSWQTAELALAPLAPGDYVVELSLDSTVDQKRTLVPFRIVP